MKTKLFSLAAGLLFAAAPAFACGDSAEVKISMSNDNFTYWQGLDIGVNGYFNQRTNSIETPSGYGFLELDYARSRSFAWNMGQYNFHIVKNYVQLVTGFGLEWNSYALRRNVSLVPNGDSVLAVTEPLDFSKNKLKSTWINAPVMLEFNTSKNPERNFHLGAGVTFGYNIFRNRLKQEFTMNGDEQKRVLRDDFNINPFRYSATVRVGYGNFTLFVNYGLNELFKSNRGPAVHPFSAGISLNID
jgi:hypothetical protein